MTVRDAAVKSERTQLPLRGAVRGLWTLAGEHPQAAVGAEYGAILGRRKQREINVKKRLEQASRLFSFRAFFCLAMSYPVWAWFLYTRILSMRGILQFWTVRKGIFPDLG